MLLKALELPQEAAVVGPIRQELDSVLSSMLQNNAAEAQTCLPLLATPTSCFSTYRPVWAALFCQTAAGLWAFTRRS